MNRLTRVEGLSTLIKDGWKKKDTEKNYTSICYGCEEIRKCVNKCGFCKALDKLAAYEDTGLEPKEIKYLKAELDLIREFNALQLTEIRRYKDLEEQGRLVKLPCKVGDTVYSIFCDKIYEKTIDRIIINRFTTPQLWIETKLPFATSKIERWDMAIGKTIFLTPEEAEKALEATNE